MPRGTKTCSEVLRGAERYQEVLRDTERRREVTRGAESYQDVLNRPTVAELERSRYQEAYMGSSPVLDKSKSWFIYPSTRLVSQGRTRLDGL